MTSFATIVKNDLARQYYEEDCCQKAELHGLLRMGGVITKTSHQHIGIRFLTANAAIARKTLILIKKMADVKTEVIVRRSKKLKKNNYYTIYVLPSPSVKELLENIGILNGATKKFTLSKKCCPLAYLRGSFEGGGSVNRPEAICHLEFVTESRDFAKRIFKEMKKLYLPVGLVERRMKYVVYLKEGDAIIEFLRYMGADKEAEDFEVARNIKEVKSQVNRIVNCETANLEKTARAAQKQLQAIKILEKEGIKNLKEELQETIQARLQNPTLSLGELAKILYLSRSGLMHRMENIIALAEQIEKKNMPQAKSTQVEQKP